VTASNSTADIEPTTPNTPDDSGPAQEAIFSGVRLSDDDKLEGSRVVPKWALTHSIAVDASAGTDWANSPAWVKNS
jgi:hypothetical protein